MELPEHVHRVVSGGRAYYYYHPNRGTKHAGPRTALPDPDKNASLFFREVERLAGSAVTFPPGSVGDLIGRYRDSQDFKRNKPKTQAVYGVHLDRFASADSWGLLRARDLTPPGVLAARDAMAETPVMANQMLSVGRTVWGWAVPLGYVADNPFDKVKPLRVDDTGHVPWPLWAVEHVLANAPEDLARLVRIGRMTCQRESDLIRFGPAHRERAGIWCRPQKTSAKRKAFFIPLQTVDALELDRWAGEPITFTNTRWKAPRAVENGDLYVFSPRGKPYTTDSLRARWGRWLTKTAEGRQLCRRWREWLTECVARYEWDIDPGEKRGPTIHGLRGSGILLRLASGYDVDQISNDVGMSRPMVSHYMRFRDQMEVAAAGRTRLRLVGDE